MQNAESNAWKYMKHKDKYLVGKCADPCGTAIQGQHMIEPQQAADTLSPSKNQFNIEEGL